MVHQKDNVWAGSPLVLLDLLAIKKKKMKEKIKNVQTFKLKFKVKSFKVKTIERTMGVNS